MRRSILLILLLLLAASVALDGRPLFAEQRSASVGAQPAPGEGGTSETAGGEERQTLSPLHAFLGIDEETGQFLPSERSPTDDAGDGELQSSRSQSDRRSRASDEQPPGELEEDPYDRASRLLERAGRGEDISGEADEAMAAVAELLQEDEDLMGRWNSLLPPHLQQDWSRFGWYFTLLLAAVLMVYPLRIVLSEIASWLSRRGEPVLTDLDRRYWRKRVRRRLMMATLSATLVLLMTVGAYLFPWYRSASWFTGYCVISLVLTFWIGGLSFLIKRAEARYEKAVVQQLRRQQLELQQEVDELRRRLARYSMTVEV